ncbi:metallophosphoesterase family protein [Halovenus sp. HT40]|uniref:metallophosphoesterase family protein n=1 Tax=Halovenus sp. HT40 TaxID=3126691 RepID=UPI00300F534A
MNILCVSDLHLDMQLHDLIDEIERREPSLILLAGDILSDTKGDDGKINQFASLLEYLRANEIYCCMISGNHDNELNMEDVEFADCLYAELEYDDIVNELTYGAFTEEISGQEVIFTGDRILSPHETTGLSDEVLRDSVRIAGVPFEFTHRLGKARQLGDVFDSKYDIVLAHANSRRRAWLFDIDTQFIVSGHFGTNAFELDGSMFVSIDRGNIVTIQPKVNSLRYNSERGSTKLRFRNTANTDTKIDLDQTQDRGDCDIIQDETDLYRSKRSQEVISIEETIEYESDENGSVRREDRLKKVVQAKRMIESEEHIDRRSVAEELLEEGVSRTQVKECIGRYEFL